MVDRQDGWANKFIRLGRLTALRRAEGSTRIAAKSCSDWQRSQEGVEPNLDTYAHDKRLETHVMIQS